MRIYTKEQWNKQLDKWSKKDINKFIIKNRKKINRRGNDSVMRRNSFYARELRIKITNTEKIFAEYLLNENINFYFQKGFINPFHRIVDFYIPSISLIVEIDGGYHQDTVEKDKRKDYLWKTKRNLNTLRITNEQVLNGSYKQIFSNYLTYINIL